MKRVSAIVIAVTIFLAATVPALGASVTAAKAKSLAEKQVPSGSVYLRTEDDDGRYEVKFYHEKNAEHYEYKVSKATGKIVSFQSEAFDRRGGGAVKFTEKQAKRVVTGENNRAEILSVALNTDDGYWEYRLDFSTKTYYGQYTINAETGKVLKREIQIGALPAERDTADLLTKAEAVKLARKQVPDGVVTDVDLDLENGVFIYEIELYHDGFEYDLAFNAKTGKLLWNSSNRVWDSEKWYDDWNDRDDKDDRDDEDDDWDDEDDRDDDARRSDGVQISLEKAKRIALAQAPNASLHEIELDDDDGRAVYEGKLRGGSWEYEFKIDATTGKLLEWEQEYDD